jgi:hypothetical protein
MENAVETRRVPGRPFEVGNPGGPGRAARAKREQAEVAAMVLEMTAAFTARHGRAPDVFERIEIETIATGTIEMRRTRTVPPTLTRAMRNSKPVGKAAKGPTLALAPRSPTLLERAAQAAAQGSRTSTADGQTRASDVPLQPATPSSAEGGS